MNNLKKIIIVLSIFIMIILVIMVVIKYQVFKNKNVDMNEIYLLEEIDTSVDDSIELIKEVKEVDDRRTYYIMKNIVEKYFSYVKQYQTDVLHTKLEGDITVTPEEKEANFDILYTLYDQEYIEDSGLDKNQIKSNLKKYEEADDISIDKMYYQDISDNIGIFIADISLCKEHKRLDGDNRILARIDKMKTTFAIIPENNQYEDMYMENSLNFSDKEIQKNTYNKYPLKNIEDTQIIEDFLYKYKDMVLYNREEAYDLFEEEYRNKRFGDYQAFSKYVDNNLQDIAKLSFTKYLVNNYDGYKEYVCKDKYENLYIFHETTVMNFKIMLDTYTLDNEKFLQKYNSSDDQYKVAMNIDKWVQMLNNRDYQAAFNVLDETFRTNNFENDVDQFEEYMRKYFPEHYKLEFGEFSEETGTYMQEITLKDITEQDEKEISKTIYMELGEGTNFVMSFNLTRH